MAYKVDFLTRVELVNIIEGLGLLIDEAQEEHDKNKRHSACVLRAKLLEVADGELAEFGGHPELVPTGDGEKTLEHYESRKEYGVHLNISVRLAETGEEIGSQTEVEYYPTYAEAEKKAEEYQGKLGDVICHWGSGYDLALGYLEAVGLDDYPVYNQYPVSASAGRGSRDEIQS